MVEVIAFAAEPRRRVGTGGARATRRAGRLPAVVYGSEVPPLAVSLDARGLSREIEKPAFLNTLMDLKVDAETFRVLPREVQYHPVTDVPLHVDFLRVSATTEVTVAIPVIFVNEEECRGLRRGGVLNVVRHDVDLVCTPAAIPQTLEVDLGGLDIGDSVHISDVPLPEGVRPAIADRDFTIATIAAPTVIPTEEEEAAAEEEAAEVAAAEEAAAAAEAEAEEG
jgi:large subunit ribosomal protein L25